MLVPVVIGLLLCLGFAPDRSSEPAPAGAQPSPSPANPRSSA